MIKKTPFVKALLIAMVMSVLAYVGLEVPEDSVEEVVDAGLETFQSDEVQVEGTAYKVEKVIDGDTLRVTVDGVSESVRVLGINTPETKYSNRGAECFGDEASVYAKTLLEGTSIQLTADDSQDMRDKYGRLLAYITLPDGRDFGQTMIADGYAYEYTFKGYKYKNQLLYKDTQAQAEGNEIGLWSEGACEG